MVDLGLGRFDRLFVAAVQFEPLFANPRENRMRMMHWAVEAARKGAKLIVFPEMCVSGYIWDNRREIAPFTETIPGPTTEALVSVTRTYNTYIVAGLPEVDPLTGKFYNAAVLVGPEGVVGKYRKTHLYAPDLRWACEGDLDIPIFMTPIGRIGMLICMDAMYFEPARIAAIKGADIVAFPTNWVGEKNNPPSTTWRLRAAENGVYWVAANRWGMERGVQFTGGTTVIDPRGNFEQWLPSGDGIVMSEVSLPVECLELDRRRPEFYDDLVLPPMTWNEEEVLSLPPPGTFDLLVIHDSYFGREAIGEYLRHVLAQGTDRKSGIPRLVVLPGPQPVHLQGTDTRCLIKELCEVATAENAFLTVALPQEDEHKSGSTVFLIGPEGIVGTSRPVHAELTTGDADFQTFDLPFARVGVLSGEDAVFPESYRILSRRGADVIVISSTRDCVCPEPWAMRIWARENDVILAAAVPAEVGRSLIFHHKRVDAQAAPQDESPLVQRFTPELLHIIRQKLYLRRLKTRWYDVLRQRVKNVSGYRTRATEPWDGE